MGMMEHQEYKLHYRRITVKEVSIHCKKIVIGYCIGYYGDPHHNLDTFYYHSENYTLITLELESS